MPFPTLKGPDYYPVRGFPMGAFRADMGAFRRHAHEFFEIVLVAAGQGRHLLFEPDSDEPHQYPLRENDLFLIPLGWSHAYSEGAGARIYNVIWDAGFLESDLCWFGPPSHFIEILRGTPAPSDEPILRKIHLAPAERAALESCLRAIARELAIRHPGFEMLTKAKLVEAITLIERAHAARQGGLADTAALYDTGSPVAQSIAFMESRLADQITLDDIARAAHLSPRYFCEVFKSATGLTPVAYLTRLRIDHARYLLLRGDLSITTIAARSGFPDASYFARIFKQSTGLTPRQLKSPKDQRPPDLPPI
jgi:AraC family L-rhamnose operon transcriptional activator RhaR